MALFAIVRDPIDPRTLEARGARLTSSAASSIFLGVVREHAEDGRPVTGLSMKRTKLWRWPSSPRSQARLANAIRGVRLGIVHRVGDLRIGEIAVAVCAASAHRAHAFDACRYAIDELKARAPIWKKERYADGTGEWVANAC